MNAGDGLAFVPTINGVGTKAKPSPPYLIRSLCIPAFFPLAASFFVKTSGSLVECCEESTYARIHLGNRSITQALGCGAANSYEEWVQAFLHFVRL